MSRVQMKLESKPAFTSDPLALTELEHIQRRLRQLQEDLSKTLVAPQPPACDDLSLGRLVKEILRSRRKRETVFGGALFGEPAWDILLELYAAQLTCQDVPVSSICEASAVPPTTALRWVVRLEKEGWVQRRRDHSDARRSLVELTAEGSTTMRAFLGGIAIRAG
jgi:DNA-binding MarR family transcriptional regulator